MNINNELPREVENSIRKLCDDDYFVDAAWGALAGYHDMRGLELIRMPLDEAKQGAHRVLAALETLRDEMRLYNGVALIPSKLQPLDDIESAYSENLKYLESINID